jgi:hypothetical protein
LEGNDVQTMKRNPQGSVGQWGCMSVVVLVLLTAGIWVGLVGKDMIVDEPPALCGSQIMEEGETCESYSRHLKLAAAQIQRLASENAQLRQALEASAKVTHIGTARQPRP